MNETKIKKQRVKKIVEKQPTEGAGLLKDLFVRPFVPDKKVKQLTGDAALYGKMANESYKRTDAADTIDGFSKEKEFSQINAVIYTNIQTRTIIMAIRGTNLSNPSDLLTDVSVLTGTLKASKRYKDISDLFNKVYAKYGKYIGKSLLAYKYIIVGHSLGGSLALQLLMDNVDKIDSIYIFNVGSSVDQLRKGLATKIGKFLGVNYYKKISKKINIYRVSGDPVSLTSRFLNGSYTEVESSKVDRHGMSNFLPAKPSKPTFEPTIAIQTEPRKPSWSYTPRPDLSEVKPEIKSDPVENTTNEKEQQEKSNVVGSGMNKRIKNKNLSIDKMDQVDTMNKKQMMDFIRTNKKYKQSLSGYSKMQKEELRTNLKRVMNGEVVSKRAGGKPSPWLIALKEWNKDKATYSIPKKGSKEHDEVLALMKGSVIVLDKPKSKRSKVVVPE